jgi:hypothetical protein
VLAHPDEHAERPEILVGSVVFNRRQPD